MDPEGFQKGSDRDPGDSSDSKKGIDHLAIASGGGVKNVSLRSFWPLPQSWQRFLYNLACKTSTFGLYPNHRDSKIRINRDASGSLGIPKVG